MTRSRWRSLLHSVLWVLGAVLIGGGLHRSIVTGETAVTTPVILAQLVVGLVFVVAGYALRTAPRDRFGETEGEGEDRTGEEYDPELSPTGTVTPGDDDATE